MNPYQPLCTPGGDAPGAARRRYFGRRRGDDWDHGRVADRPRVTSTDSKETNIRETRRKTRRACAAPRRGNTERRPGARRLLAPQSVRIARHVLRGALAAMLERHAERLEFLAGPADADPERSSRPPHSTSSEAACLASRTGLCSGTSSTPVAIPMRGPVNGGGEDEAIGRHRTSQNLTARQWRAKTRALPCCA